MTHHDLPAKSAAAPERVTADAARVTVPPGRDTALPERVTGSFDRITASSDAASDPLAAFPTEAEVAAAAVRKVRRHQGTVTRAQQLIAAAVRKVRRHQGTVTRALLLIAAAAVLAGAIWVLMPKTTERLRSAAASRLSPAAATLAIETTPAGWEVVEAGRVLGTTPFRGTLPPGRHELLLRRGGETRPLEVTLESRSQVVHHLDLTAAASTGVLSVSTSPPGAAVEIDGVSRGVSPLEIAGLAPGTHIVSVRAGNRTVTEAVTVAANRTTTLLVPVTLPEAPAATVGYVNVSSPIELQVFDGEALVGSSRNQRIMVVPGRRSLRLVNATAGFERVVEVVVETGATAKVSVPVPNGSLSVNASPWAEVWLDGTRIGETPIANFAVLPGSHELVLRNPKFPEHRRTIVVTLAAPLRVGIDLRQ